MPLGDPLGTPFTGNIQGIAAKWEVEIHKLGRQIIGQIDSKMSALQTITLDANRTANRLEILVEHLEQIARQQMEWQQNQREQSAETEELPIEGSPTVIPATVSIPEKANPLGNVLKELADDLDDIHQTIKRSTVLMEQPEPATILRMASETAYSNLRSEVEMLVNYGLEPQDIAQRLNISLGEVDLMLQVQQNRLDRTM
jgi:DNA-directed RNA polymerase specialized sigma24 family protein